MAVRFDADGEDYTRTTNLPSGTTFSLCLWLIIDTDRNTFSCPISLDAGTGSFVYLETEVDGTTLYIFEGDDAVATGPSVNLSVGTWYFIALTRNGAGANSGTLYSAEAGAAALTSGQRTLDTSFTPNTLRIGESPWGSEWWNGRVAAVKIWDGVALSQAEIENERFQYLPHRTANLNAFYPFLQGGAVAGAQQDYSGAGNNLSNGTNSATADGPPIPWRRGPLRAFIPAVDESPGGIYLLETGADGYLLENASGVLILEETEEAEPLLFTATVTPAGSFSKTVMKPYSGSISPTGSLAKTTTKPFTATITPTGLLTTLRTILQIFTATITPTGALTMLKAVLRSFTATITPEGSLARSVTKSHTGTITPAGVFAQAASFLRSFTATVSPAGSLLKTITKPFTATITPSGALTSLKLIVRAFAATITPAGAFTKISIKGFVASITPAGSFAKVASFARTHTATIAPAGALRKTVFKFYTAVIAPIGTFLGGLFGVADKIRVTVSDRVKTRAVVSDQAKTQLTLSDRVKTQVAVSDEQGN